MDSHRQQWAEVDKDGYTLSYTMDKRRQQWNTMDREGYRWIAMWGLGRLFQNAPLIKLCLVTTKTKMFCSRHKKEQTCKSHMEIAKKHINRYLHDPSLSIVFHYCVLLSIVCDYISIGIHFYPSLSITIRRYPSLSNAVHSISLLCVITYPSVSIAIYFYPSLYLSVHSTPLLSSLIHFV